jgi:hypothetical protein
MRAVDSSLQADDEQRTYHLVLAPAPSRPGGALPESLPFSGEIEGEASSASFLAAFGAQLECKNVLFARGSAGSFASQVLSHRRGDDGVLDPQYVTEIRFHEHLKAATIKLRRQSGLRLRNTLTPFR